MKRLAALATLFLLAALPAAVLAGDMLTPRMALERFEVQNYDGFWHFDKTMRPSRGQIGEHGAPLSVSFIFLVANINTRPIELRGIKFSAVFDGFCILAAKSRDAVWLPPGKTVRVRVNACTTANAAFEKISTDGAALLAERGISAWDEVEAIYKGASANGISLEITDGSAEFSDGARSIVAPFSQEFRPPRQPEPPPSAEKPKAPAKTAQKPAAKPVKPAEKPKEAQAKPVKP